MTTKTIILSLSNEEDINRFETIEDLISLFKIYKDKPSLKDALEDLYLNSNISLENAKEITKFLYDTCESFINGKFNKIKQKHPKITKEEAIIICSYTKEIPNKYKADPPYKILNKSMTSEKRENGIHNVAKYLLVLLLALRKLEKCYKDILYRGMGTNVIKDKDINGNKYKYNKEDVKKWWGFTSTTISEKLANSFLKDNSYGTIFAIKGSKLWGYDLSDFSEYNEKEILLIPEREIKIKDIKQNGDITRIECDMLEDTTLILEDCNECPNCGSLNIERINKFEQIEISDGLECLSFTDTQKNYLLDKMLGLFNRTNDKKYKCNNCSNEYELKSFGEFTINVSK